MKIAKMLQDLGQYLSEAMSRIFAPNDDSYPETGTQPYTGETDKRKNVKKLKKVVKD